MSEDISWEQQKSIRQSLINKTNERYRVISNIEIVLGNRYRDKEYFRFIKRLVVQVNEMDPTYLRSFEVYLRNCKEEEKKIIPAEASNLCCICLENDVNSVLIPCGHLSLCYGCCVIQDRQFENHCPICCSKVDSFVKTYKS